MDKKYPITGIVAALRPTVHLECSGRTIVRALYMRALATAFLLAAVGGISAQPVFLDFYDEDYNPNIGWRLNNGQVIDTDGTLRSEVMAKSEGIPLTIWPCAASTVTFSWRSSSDPPPAPLDRLNRIDITPAGELANKVDPDWKAPRPGHTNYYYPHTAPDGVEGVISYSKVVYEGIYPDIDLILYSGSGGPKMAYVCWPGSDPTDILLLFEGQDSLKLDTLLEAVKIYLDGKSIELKEAKAYQWDANENILPMAWDAEYIENANGTMLYFDIDTYDPLLPLVFLIGAEPEAMGGGGNNGNMDWSTLVGNGGTNPDDPMMAVETHPDGDALVAGYTNDDAYPASTGLVSYTGGRDCIVGRYLFAPGNSTDDARTSWVTFMGGTGNDFAHAIAYDEVDDAVVMGGYTNSTDIVLEPQNDPNDGTYWQGSNKGGYDGLLTYFDAFDGTRSRTTYYGGEGDEMITGVATYSGGTWFAGATTTALGASGTGCTATATGFPVCDAGGFFLGNNQGSRDAFVAHIDATHHLQWSTFYGQSAENEALGITIGQVDDVTSNTRVVVTGSTVYSIATTGPSGSFQSTFFPFYSGGFLASFRTNHTLHWATNLKLQDGIEDATISNGRCVVVGSGSGGTVGCQPSGADLPLCDPGGGAYFRTISPAYDQYIADFDLLTGTLTWSTFIGGETKESIWLNGVWPHFTLLPFPLARTMDVELDEEGNLYMTGAVQHHSIGPLNYPSQWAAGWYYQEYDANSGLYQADIVLNAFLADRSKYWTSILGASVYHVDSLQDLFIAETWSDYSLGLAVSDANAVYVVGVSGGGGPWPSACPYPGTSYCEADLSTDEDGFITRFNILGSALGVEQATAAPGAGMLYPNPATDHIMLTGPVPMGATFVVHDALGRAVLRGYLTRNGIDASSLATGTYAVQMHTTDGRQYTVGRFVKH